MKFGIKLFTTNYSLYKDAIAAVQKGIADYLELTLIPSETYDLDILVKSGIPIVVHAAHAGQGFNFSCDNINKSLKHLQLVIQAADFLDAKFIIIHPDKGRIENLINVLSVFVDRRLLVENMPKVALTGGDCVGFSSAELAHVMEKASCGLCLDFGHAFKAANSLNVDFECYCSQLVKLQPSMFHVAQGTRGVEHDEHLDLDDGDIDLLYVKKLIREEHDASFVTMEVPFKRGIDNTLRNIKYFQEIK